MRTSKTSKLVGQAWVLVSEDGMFPDSRTITAQLTSDLKFTHVYDSRDSRTLKIKFWSALFKKQFATMDIPQS